MKPCAVPLVSTCGAVLLLAASAIPAMSAGDAAAGQRDFAARCAGCHAATPGENKIGPSLAGVFGGTSGNVPGFHYSDALKNAHLNWDDATLDEWLRSPPGLVYGTTMLASVSSGSDRQDLIAYLKTLPADQNEPHAER
ncbi:MAG: cytochrome c [Alphaproteobacteria bacterium]|nr:cytochrome c [Alphaproteobacteria bacterium]